MKILIEGYKYALEPFEEPDLEQYLWFIQEAPVSPGSTELKTIQNGTTNEEVLKVLINRLQFMHAKLPSRESAIVITKLEESLMWLEKRTVNRKAAGVEGTMKPLPANEQTS